MRNRVEIFRQIGVYDIGVAPANQPVHFLDGVGRTATGPVTIGTILEIRLEDRFQYELGGDAADLPGIAFIPQLAPVLGGKEDETPETRFGRERHHASARQRMKAEGGPWVKIPSSPAPGETPHGP
jgi:hypothetical protein